MSVYLLFRQDSKKKEKYENDIKNGERKGGDGRKLGKNLKGTDTKNSGLEESCLNLGLSAVATPISISVGLKSADKIEDKHVTANCNNNNT